MARAIGATEAAMMSANTTGMIDHRRLGDDEDRDREDAKRGEHAPAPLGETIDPSRDEQPFRPRSGVGLERIDQCAADGDRERDDGDRREDADDAGDRRAGGNGDDDDRRVQVHRSAVDDRSEEVVDDPVGDEHQDQQDERGLGSDGAERDEQHGRHGEEGADVRDEAAEDDEDGKRQHTRHAEHHEEDGVGRCPGCRQDGGSPEVPADALERIPTARIDPRALRIRRDLEQPIPGALTVIEDEEREDQGEDGDGDDRRNDPDDAADRRPEPCADAIGDLLEERTDHGWER